MQLWKCGAAAVTVLASALLAMPAAAQEFPSRRLSVIVPYPAGGVVDVVTRVTMEKLSALLQQPIVVDNKPGANGNLGTEVGARAAPDGYTLTFFGPPVMTNPRIYSNLRWTEASFKVVGVVAWAPAAMVVPPGSKAGTVAEFIELAKRSPGDLNYGNAGIGSSVHINTTLFMRDAGIQLTSIPYKGQPPAIIDLLAGRIDVMFASTGQVASHVREGGLKALAVVGNQRSALLPDVPTMTEAGYAAANLVPWYGYAVPKDVPQAIVARIAAAFVQAVSDPAVRQQLAQQGLEAATPMGLPEIAALLAKDTERYATLIREAQIKLKD